jgi:mono/diheme cytochrome c family protein
MKNLLQDRLLWFGGYVLSPTAAIITGLLMLSGCSITATSRRPPIEVWDDMDRQEKFKAQSAVGRDLYGVFADHRSNRRPVDGTIARGHLLLNEPASTGLVNANTYLGQNPVPLDEAVMKLGHDKYQVYCTPCHDATGAGKGIVNIREPNYKPANLMDDRIKGFSDGQIFYTITNGKGNMQPYHLQLSVRERWAVAYYVRALQRAHSGTLADVPEDKKGSIQ